MTQKERKKKIDKASDKLVRWIGSTNSLFAHTIFFIVMFLLIFLNINFDTIMLVLTTIVSLEAIYLAIFIQMTVNKHSEELEEVSEDIDEIQKDVDEIQKDVDEIQEDVEGISEDVEEIQKDVDEIQEDVDEIQEDVEEISEDTDEEKNKNKEEILDQNKLNKIEKSLESILEEISKLKK